MNEQTIPLNSSAIETEQRKNVGDKGTTIRPALQAEAATALDPPNLKPPNSRSGDGLAESQTGDASVTTAGTGNDDEKPPLNAIIDSDEPQGGSPPGSNTESRKDESSGAITHPDNHTAASNGTTMTPTRTENSAPNPAAIHIDTVQYSKKDLRTLAKKLSRDVVFFHKHASSMAKLKIFPYTMVPSYYTGPTPEDDGTNKESQVLEQRKRISKDATHFPFLPGRGKLQIPIAILCEGKTHLELLVVINYWRQLRSDEQHQLKKKMYLFYLRPLCSNEPITYTATTYHHSAPRASSRVSKRSLPWGFRCLETCTQLAQVLGLTVLNSDTAEDEIAAIKQACDWLRTANLESPRVECKREGCIYPALARNNGACCRHGFYFVPSSGDARDHKQRGLLMLGDLYTRPYTISKSSAADVPATTRKLPSCSCRNKTCLGIGYSPSMMAVDVQKLEPPMKDEIWKILDMGDPTSNSSSNNNNNNNNNQYLRLAPWHFHPQYRTQFPDGTWRLCLEHRSPSSVFVDPITNQEWKGILPPTYSPKDFLEEPQVKEYTNRKTLEAIHGDALPRWCLEYAKLESGPYSRVEEQRRFLLEKTIELEDHWTQGALTSSIRESTLQADVDRLQAKYDEKKFLKRRGDTKKRKRSSTTKPRATDGNGNNTGGEISTSHHPPVQPQTNHHHKPAAATNPLANLQFHNYNNNASQQQHPNNHPPPMLPFHYVTDKNANTGNLFLFQQSFQQQQQQQQQQQHNLPHYHQQHQQQQQQKQKQQQQYSDKEYRHPVYQL